MTPWQTTWEVARWEFRRFLKPKQLVISMVTMLVTGGVTLGIARLVRGSRAEIANVAVIGGDRVGLGGDTLASRIALAPRSVTAEAALRDSARAGDLDGLLIVRDAHSAELVVRRDPAWRMDLEQALTGAAIRHRLAESGLEQGALQQLASPMRVAVTRPPGGGPGRGERILTGAVLTLSLLGLMTGMGFIFAGITGEKQQRVTEQVISAIAPQQWIDGKIIGLAGVALANTLVTAVTFGGLFAVFAATTGRPLTLSVDQPMLVPLLVLLPMLGFALWFAFLSAIAATIDDPHTSTKGSLLMVPVVPVVVAFMLFSRADTGVAQFFGVFPLTASAVLPLRLLLAEVAAWEVPLAIALLVGAIWFFRRAAGKIFAVGMLMYGKEPTVREMWRWAREG
ncbi:MAG TPA: ABC transporter permease [Gemmatimonadaceae bacterium]|nr:ABC transporter permease [Gemmatimonadaceae bacterium]